MIVNFSLISSLFIVFRDLKNSPSSTPFEPSILFLIRSYAYPQVEFLFSLDDYRISAIRILSPISTFLADFLFLVGWLYNSQEMIKPGPAEWHTLTFSPYLTSTDCNDDWLRKCFTQIKQCLTLYTLKDCVGLKHLWENFSREIHSSRGFQIFYLQCF